MFLMEMRGGLLGRRREMGKWSLRSRGRGIGVEGIEWAEYMWADCEKAV